MASARTPDTQDSAPVDYDLTCWYLNQRRVLELVGVDSVAPRLGGRGPGGAWGETLLERGAYLMTRSSRSTTWCAEPGRRGPSVLRA